ncbi:MAG: rhodanese-like domain-containing protein [Deltaproteobacteria bacterium]|nr:rhodanese-like domain-containing protein [Deltaproteobacteria bacterium]
MKKISFSMVWLMTGFFSLSLAVSAFGKPIAWDAALVRPVETVIKKHRDNQVVLVDVRAQKDFDRARIPGSVHVPLTFLKTKTFLKGKDLVLIGDGREWLPLEATCRDLKTRGFRVSILAGGISAWLAGGGKVAGDAASLLKEKTISAAVFSREKDLEGRLVVYLGQKATKELSELLPGCVALDTKKQAAQCLKKELAVQTSALPPLVLNAAGQGYARAEADFRRNGVANVLFVEGGLAGYRTFLQGRKRAALPREERLKTVGGCATCGRSLPFSDVPAAPPPEKQKEGS